MAGYETCIVPATGSVDVDIEGISFNALGYWVEDVWGAEPEAEGVYVPIGAKPTMACVFEETGVFISDAKSDKVLEPFDVRSDDLDLLQYGLDGTKTHHNIKHIFGSKYHDKIGDLLVSELLTVGEGGWSGFSSYKHATDQLPDQTPPR